MQKEVHETAAREHLKIAEEYDAKMMKTPKESEILGIGLIRQAGFGGRNLNYYCFDYKLRRVNAKISGKCGIVALKENSLVLINIIENKLVYNYSRTDIRKLCELGYLNDLPHIVKEKEKLKEKMFSREIIDESSKSKLDIISLCDKNV